MTGSSAGKPQPFVIGNRTIGLFAPDAAAMEQAYKKGDIPFPYWSRVWPAAIGLSLFLEAHPHWLQNKTVLELAAGLGLPAMVAARYAQTVLCTDYVPEAVAHMHRSAAYNGLTNVEARVMDWCHLPAGLHADVLLLSDVSYDPALFATQHQVITRFLAAGATVIISTPQRLMAKQAIAPLLAAAILQTEVTVVQSTGAIAITVVVLAQNEQPAEGDKR